MESSWQIATKESQIQVRQASSFPRWSRLKTGGEHANDLSSVMSDTSTYDCQLVVLNYNGLELLQACLPSIQAAVERSQYRCRLTILDNQSHDESEAWLKKHYPDVTFVKSPENLVYCSYNDYIATIDEPYFIILNNDIKVEPDFIDPLLDRLVQDDTCFMTAPQSKNIKSGAYEGNLSKMELRHGLIWGSSTFAGHETKTDRLSITMQSGYGAFRRSMFLELKGFDRLFLPGTVEDTDFCFRAYRQGWKSYYCPKSIVYHMGQMSFKKAFGTFRIQRMNRRNLYLFTWKNIRDPSLLVLHVLYLPIHVMKHLLFREWAFLLGIKDAFQNIFSAWRRRKATRNEASVVRDRDIFRLSEGL